MLTQAQRAELAARLRRGRDARGAGHIPRRDPALTTPPASFGQEQLWFLDRFAPGQATYNIPCLLRVTGPLDAAALSRALGALTARHESLRTRLVTGADGRPVQVIDPPEPAKLPVAELSWPEVVPFVHAEAMRPFDLAAGPLLRGTLIRAGSADHFLLAVIHHVVFDGWSAGLFLRDLAALYHAEVTGAPAGLAELPVQFGDYAAWERARFTGDGLAELEGYWRQALHGLTTVQFPADRPRPAVDDFTGGRAERTAGTDLLNGLRELSRSEGTTLFTTLLAALFALLCRYTGQDDLVVGTVSANRSRPELAPLIGFLVNTLPIRCDASGDPPFSELLARVKNVVIAAFAHQDLPFGKLVDSLNVPRDASKAPLFQIAFSYAERGGDPVLAGGAEFTASDLVVGIDAAKFDLTFATEARRDGLWLECCYKTALFQRDTVERLLAHLERLLRGIAANPGARLSELPLLSEEERRAELGGRAEGTGAPPQRCAHELFEAQAARAPDAIAAEYPGARVTYAELDRSAGLIARRLRALGAGPETLTGICMGPGPGRLAAVLGVWKAGGGYVPLDPALPVERLAFMIADTGMRVVLTDVANADALPAGNATVLHLDGCDIRTAIGGRVWHSSGDVAAPMSTASPDNVAYVIYTSGSTGRPKGVVVEHRNLVSFTGAMTERWGVGPGDRVLSCASFAFDASVIDMIVPVLAGATVLFAPPGTVHTPARLAASLREDRVTFVFLSPAVLDLLPEGDYPDLRVLMTGADEVPAALVRRWLRPGLRLVNAYGPTEGTVAATWAELTPDTPMPPPIGYPVRDGYGYVLDRHGNPVPAGVPGELYIGGAGVARGYLNRPELTRERFLPDPFRPGGRLYRTGDLVRRRPDGSLVFLGRMDGQVKIRGVRIELGEIEAALADCPGVAQAVVTVVTGASGDKELAGYLRRADQGGQAGHSGAAAGGGQAGHSGAAAGGGQAEDDGWLAGIRARLARTLPAAMIPAHLIPVTEFPLNSSGKVDRSALPPPDRQLTGGHGPGCGDKAGAAPALAATPAERLLASVFGQVLGRDDVGLDDSFFDLGGNSLTAMRLADMIGRQAHADIAVTAIFLHPTPRQLATLVAAPAGGGAGPEGTGPLLMLTGGAAAATTAACAGEPPLVLIHAVGGTVSAYLPLGRALAGTCEVAGLESPAISGAAPVPATFGSLVADYARRIGAAWPDGPYRLGGWSMGAVLAFEVARRLEQAGAAVSSLVMLDPPFAIPDGFAGSEAELAARFAADAARSLGVAQDTLDLGTGQMRRRLAAFAAHSRLLAGYQPSGPPVRAATLLVSAEGSPNAVTRTRWPDLIAGPVTVLSVPGDHYTFLRPPLVADVALAISKVIGNGD